LTMVQDNPYFDLDTVVIGLPPFISACVGGIVALIFTYQISCVSMDLDTKGDPARVKMAAALIKLNEAIANGATAFFIQGVHISGYCCICLICVGFYCCKLENWLMLFSWIIHFCNLWICGYEGSNLFECENHNCCRERIKRSFKCFI